MPNMVKPGDTMVVSHTCERHGVREKHSVPVEVVHKHRVAKLTDSTSLYRYTGIKCDGKLTHWDVEE